MAWVLSRVASRVPDGFVVGSSKELVLTGKSEVGGPG